MLDNLGRPFVDRPEAESRRQKMAGPRELSNVAGGPDPMVLLTVANWMFSAGDDLDASILLADRAVLLNPESQRVWQASGILRLQSGESRHAYDHLRTALRLNPHSPDRPILFGLLALALFGFGRFRQAVSHARHSVQLRPQWPLPHAVLATAFGHLGDAFAAREAIERHRALSAVDIGDWAESWSPDLGVLIMEGLALAEKMNPLGVAVGDQ
jgi:tetratricopeptide (TPR) repeat protein